MMPTLQLRRTSLFWFSRGMGVESSFWRRVVLFLFVCLFVCFSTPKVGDYFVFKSHKCVRFSFFFFFCFVLFCFVLFLFLCVCVCFVLFFFQNVQFPHHISRVRLIFFFFLSHQLVKFFAFFYFCLLSYLILFCFLLSFQKFHPLDIKWCALILILLHRWCGHYVIDNFEFPCNSVKNLIPIWNFTNAFIQECKIIWEFQIRWGGTSLLKPLWRSWTYLKAYSLMSNRGGFQNLKKNSGGPAKLDSMWQHRLKRPLHLQHMYYRIIFKQNPFNIISRGVQRWTSTDFRLK